MTCQTKRRGTQVVHDKPQNSLAYPGREKLWGCVQLREDKKPSRVPAVPTPHQQKNEEHVSETPGAGYLQGRRTLPPCTHPCPQDGYALQQRQKAQSEQDHQVSKPGAGGMANLGRRKPYWTRSIDQNFRQLWQERGRSVGAWD